MRKNKAVAETVLPVTYLDGEIEFTFFRCSHYGEIYPVGAMDKALREDIAECIHLPMETAEMITDSHLCLKNMN